MKPVSWYESVRIEKMQINVQRGEWIQIVANYGDRFERKIQIIQVQVEEDGTIKLNSNIPAEPWESASKKEDAGT